MTTLSSTDKELARRAQDKMLAGEPCTAAEKRAYLKAQKAHEERQLLAQLEDIPRKFYNILSGRQNNTLQQQADRYGLPLRGERLNLRAIITGFHDFLRDNAHKLAADTGGIDPDLIGKDSPALERYRDEKAQIIKLQRLEMERQLIPREDVREGLSLISQRLRQAGEALKKRHGAGAAEILEDAISDAARIQRQHFESRDANP